MGPSPPWVLILLWTHGQDLRSKVQGLGLRTIELIILPHALPQQSFSMTEVPIRTYTVNSQQKCVVVVLKKVSPI